MKYRRKMKRRQRIHWFTKPMKMCFWKIPFVEPEREISPGAFKYMQEWLESLAAEYGGVLPPDEVIRERFSTRNRNV